MRLSSRLPSSSALPAAPLLALSLALSACVEVPVPDLSGLLPSGDRPVMAWDHRAEAPEWTARTLAAVARHDDVLATRVPEDIAAWCPGYAKASIGNRRAFWAGVLSVVGRHESSWNPKASGGGGRYIGIMQISPKSAAQHGCTATTASALKDGAANLECAVEMMAVQVEDDGVVTGSGKRGIGRDWMPFRDAGKRAAMAAWTSGQSYCR